MKVYMDDMLVKRCRAGQHLADLKETFKTMRKYYIKLNLGKYAFGVALGKFLGFLITHRGIEINLEKIQAIIEMMPPKTQRVVQHLTGHVAALSRLVAKLVKKCLPFSKSLK